MSGQSHVGFEAIDKLVTPLRVYVSNTVEFPEPATRLDLESRVGDPVRQFKHIHQLCLLHGENFTRSNQIKLVSLLDGFLLVGRAQNLLGQYMFARSILELSAFTYEVALRLQRAADKPDAGWKSKGEEFFSLIVRARFATTDSTKRLALEKAGLPSRLLKPFNVMNCLAELARDAEHGHIVSHYEKFCDFVHHNSSSQFASSVGYRIGDRATSHGGGALIMKDAGPIARYEYPLAKSKISTSDIVPVVVEAAELVVETFNAIPSTPFSRDQLVSFTGNHLGLVQV